jgi:sulfate/thiosulfate transport system permease protein
MAIPADALDVALKAPPAPSSRRRFRVRPLSAVGVAGGATLLVGYLSIIVLLPIAALAAHGLGISVETHGAGLAVWNWSVHSDFAGFWADATAPAALHAIWLSLWLSLTVAAVNAVAGIAIAWVLVRDDFVGKRIVEGVIDLPFALPTIVAGIVFLFLYGTDSPVHVNLFETWAGLLVALLFVTLPFSVRAVQPVLETLDGHAEAAAKTLGAGGLRTFLTVVLPSLMPAVLSGFGLAFARAVGEFGSISLIYGGLARTTTASALIFNLMQGPPTTQVQAAAVSVALLVVSLFLLATSSALSSFFSRRLTA